MGRTKGTSIVEIVKFLRTRRDDALQALPAAVHHYLDDRVLESAWYPEEDLVALVGAMVETLDAPARPVPNSQRTRPRSQRLPAKWREKEP